VDPDEDVSFSVLVESLGVGRSAVVGVERQEEVIAERFLAALAKDSGVRSMPRPTTRITETMWP